MARINITLGTKGGIGKTLSAVAMALYYRDTREKPPICLDLDWKNHSLSKLRGLNAMPLDLETDGDVEKRKFDAFIDMVCESAADDVFILDCGSNTYTPFTSYMYANDIPQLLLGMGQELLLHLPIMGGGELDETVMTFAEIASQMPEEAPIALWMNHLHGTIDKDGKEFEQFAVWKKWGHRVRNIVMLPKMLDDMKHDLAEMFKKKMLFQEALESDEKKNGYKLIVKHRLLKASKLLRDAVIASEVCE